MNGFGVQRVLWWSALTLASVVSAVPTLVLLVLLHDHHVSAVDLACAEAAVSTVRSQRGDPEGLLEETRQRCHVDYEWLASYPPVPVPYSTRTWLSEQSAPSAAVLPGLLACGLGVALPGYVLFLGLAGIRSARRRALRVGAWQLRLALGLLLLSGSFAGIGLTVVRHDLAVTAEDLACEERLDPAPRHLEAPLSHEGSRVIGKARAVCDVEYHVDLQGFPARLEAYSARTWLAPRSRWMVERELAPAGGALLIHLTLSALVLFALLLLERMRDGGLKGRSAEAPPAG